MTHPVDERLPLPRLAALGLQHVLVMYAGAVAVPLIACRALRLAPEQVTPDVKQWMPHELHPLIQSGIRLASLTAFALTLFFNGASGDSSAAVAAARHADAH